MGVTTFQRSLRRELGRVWGPSALLTLVTACGGGAPRGAPPPPEVSIVTVAPETAPVSYEFSAQVEAYRRVEVRARVDGIIIARPFTEGAMVKPGALLYQIDPVRYQAAYQSAEARYANAKQLVDRLEPLLGQHAVAQQDVDNARAQLQSAEAAVTQTKKDLDDTDVRAEIAGQVGRTRMEVGARVTGPADLLTTIDRLDPVYVTFRPASEQLQEWNADSSSRALIRPGSKLAVKVILDDGRELPRTGVLDFVAPALDPATGTQEFRARFANSDHQLMPGQFVRVRLEGFARHDALAVPMRAVQTALGRHFLLLVGPGDTVVSRDVEPGPWSGKQWIITDGLKPGDRVIVDGVQKAAPGRTVRPTPLVDTASAPVVSPSEGAP